MFFRIGAPTRRAKYRYAACSLCLVVLTTLATGCATQPEPAQPGSVEPGSVPPESTQPDKTGQRDARIAERNAKQTEPSEEKAPDLNAREQQNANKPRLELDPDAPRRYTVKKGDTLWDLAAMFLNDPRYWPRLWAQNPAIDNPNLIYPGQTLVLTRTIDGRIRLRPANVKKLRPQIRAKPLAAAIPAIPDRAVEIFLRGDRILPVRLLDSAPYIVAFGDAQPTGTSGNKAFVKGLGGRGPERYQIVKPVEPIKDPETGRVYGIKVQVIGELRVTERGRVATTVITQSQRIAAPGNRLVPVPTEPLNRGYRPHPPDTHIAAPVIDLVAGRVVASTYQVVTIAAGVAEGLDRGAVLEVVDPGRVVADPTSERKVRLPAEQIGSVMVFRTGPHYAFGLVVRSKEAISRGDIARTPVE